MRKIIKNTDLVPIVIQDLILDSTPTEGSTNPVTSDGVKGAIDGAVGDASAALQEQIDDIAEKAGSGYIPKGEATVATLNGLSGQENGDLYTMTDAGTLTDGSLAVVAGDTVAWDATNEVWYKAMDYAPRQYGTNEVHNLPTTITAFRTGDVIPVDGPDGTAKMSKDDLLRVTAEYVEKHNKVRYEVSKELGVDIADYTLTLHYFIPSYATSPVANNAWCYSSDISLKAGKTIYVRGSGTGTNVAMISSVSGGTYTCLVPSDGNDIKWYKYINDTGADISVAFSGRTADGLFAYVSEESATTKERLDDVYSKVTEIYPVVSELCHELSIEPKNPNKNAGSFINNVGQVVSLATWFITDAITLPAGKTIITYSRGNGSYVAEISKDNGDSTYTPLVVSSSNDNAWYKYTNTTGADINVVCCGSVNYPFFCYVGEDLQGKLSEIQTLKNSVVALADDVTTCKNELGLVTPSYTFTAGSFINNAGVVTSLGSYGTTSAFTLPSGKKIKLTAAGYEGYVAMISIDNGDSTYTPLVVSNDGAGQHNVKLYEYTNETGADLNIVCCGRVADGINLYFVDPSEETTINVDTSISLFSTMAVIGDSYASGCVVNDNPNFVSHYEGSWPQILGRMNGLEVTNYTKSGQWTTGFINDTSNRGYAQMLADDAKELYIVALEINDAYFHGENLGTEADCTNDPANNPTTFYGNYAKIVWSIQNKSPKSRILCALTERTAQVYQDHNDAIRFVANKYGVPVIDCAEAPFATDTIYTNMVGGHPTAIGYTAMAQGYRYLIEKAIRDNVNYFRFYVGLDL